MEIIDELEPHKRGSYGGAIGYLVLDGDLDTAIHIRTVVVKDGRLHVQAGGGTVADAKPTTSTTSPSTRRRPSSARSRSPAPSRTGPEADDARPRHRQLRLLHLQPGPVPGRARRRDRGRPQRQGRRSPSCSSAAPTGSSSRPAPARPPRRGSPAPRSAPSPRPACRPSASASATRRWSRPSAARSSRASRSTARTPRSSTTAARSSPACRPRWSPAATTRWSPTPTCPDELELTAHLGDVVMGARHKTLPAEGVQFHPESVLTPHGKHLLANFLGKGETMPNDVVSRAIDAVCAGENLTADHASAVLAEIMEGRTEPIQTGAFLIALRAKGETVSELVGLARTMRDLADSGRTPSAPTSSTPPAPAAGPPPSTSRPPRRWSPPGRAARSPSTATAPPPRKSGSADLLEALGVDDRPRPRGGRPLHRGGRLRLHVRPAPPLGDVPRASRSARGSACARSSTSSAR